MMASSMRDFTWSEEGKSVVAPVIGQTLLDQTTFSNLYVVIRHHDVIEDTERRKGLRDGEREEVRWR